MAYSIDQDVSRDTAGDARHRSQRRRPQYRTTFFQLMDIKSGEVMTIGSSRQLRIIPQISLVRSLRNLGNLFPNSMAAMLVRHWYVHTNFENGKRTPDIRVHVSNRARSALVSIQRKYYKESTVNFSRCGEEYQHAIYPSMPSTPRRSGAGARRSASHGAAGSHRTAGRKTSWTCGTRRIWQVRYIF